MNSALLLYDKLFEFNCLCFGLLKKNVLSVSFSFLHFFTDLHVFYITVFRDIVISLRFCEQVSTGTLMITIKWWVKNRRQIMLKWAKAILADQAFIIIKEWLKKIPPPPDFINLDNFRPGAFQIHVSLKKIKIYSTLCHLCIINIRAIHGIRFKYPLREKKLLGALFRRSLSSTQNDAKVKLYQFEKF